MSVVGVVVAGVTAVGVPARGVAMGLAVVTGPARDTALVAGQGIVAAVAIAMVSLEAAVKASAAEHRAAIARVLLPARVAALT